MCSRAANGFDEQFVNAPVIDRLRRQPEPTKNGALTRSGNDLQFADEQAAHRVHVGNLSKIGILAPKIFNARRAAHAPFSRTLFFENISAGVSIAANFPDHLLQNIMNGHKAGRAAEFIEHNGQAAPLALKGLEKLKQVHARWNERWKFDRLGEIDG